MGCQVDGAGLLDEEAIVRARAEVHACDDTFGDDVLTAKGGRPAGALDLADTQFGGLARRLDLAGAGAGRRCAGFEVGSVVVGVDGGVDACDGGGVRRAVCSCALEAGCVRPPADEVDDGAIGSGEINDAGRASEARSERHVGFERRQVSVRAVGGTDDVELAWAE